MRIERHRYLEKLVQRLKNGQIKIITGIRRCGKSYLLNVLFRDYLLNNGVKASEIISLALDNDVNLRYRNPLELSSHLRSLVKNRKKNYYLLLDEIQMVEAIDNPYLPKGSGAKITFVDVLLGLKELPNVDIYVTGSNSRMLSSDVATAFRDRGEEIHITPLTYNEFYEAYAGDKHSALREFMTYGGMPMVLEKTTHEEKGRYLQDLFHLTYLKDVVERNKLRGNTGVLDDLLNVIASSVGSLSNPTRISNTFLSERGISLKNEVISDYLDYFIEAFILNKSFRYNIKGRQYISTPLKYYFTDIGLRNARLNFRQQEEGHIMENIIYNELIARNFNVDVGVVEYNRKTSDGRKTRTQLEVDFVVNRSDKRYYIQSALTVADEEKRQQEIQSLNRIDDSYTKYLIVKDNILPWTDEKGVRYISIEDFLLREIDKL